MFRGIKSIPRRRSFPDLHRRASAASYARHETAGWQQSARIAPYVEIDDRVASPTLPGISGSRNASGRGNNVGAVISRGGQPRSDRHTNGRGVSKGARGVSGREEEEEGDEGGPGGIRDSVGPLLILCLSAVFLSLSISLSLSSFLSVFRSLLSRRRRRRPRSRSSNYVETNLTPLIRGREGESLLAGWQTRCRAPEGFS